MFGILWTLYAIMYVYSYATWCTFTTDVFFNSSVYLSLRKCPWLIRRHSCSDTKEFSENFFLNYTILYFLHSKSMKNVYDRIEFLIKVKSTEWISPSYRFFSFSMVTSLIYLHKIGVQIFKPMHGNTTPEHTSLYHLFKYLMEENLEVILLPSSYCQLVIT